MSSILLPLSTHSSRAIMVPPTALSQLLESPSHRNNEKSNSTPESADLEQRARQLYFQHCQSLDVSVRNAILDALVFRERRWIGAVLEEQYVAPREWEALCATLRDLQSWISIKLVHAKFEQQSSPFQLLIDSTAVRHRLIEIVLKDCELPKHAFANLATLLRLKDCKLQKLKISGLNTLFDNEDASLLGASLAENQVLTILFIENCGIDDRNLAMLRLNQNKSINYLSLANNDLSAESMQTLVEIVARTDGKVHDLNLRGNPLFNEALCSDEALLAPLLSHLRALDLSACQFTRCGLEALLRVLKKQMQQNSGGFIRQGTILRLSHNTLSTAGVRVLFQQLHLFAALEELALRNTQLGDNALNELIAVLQPATRTRSLLSKLQKIDLADNLITYIGAVQLVEAIVEGTAGSLIDLSGNYISRASVHLIGQKMREQRIRARILLDNQKDIQDENIRQIFQLETFFNEYDVVRQKLEESWYAYCDAKDEQTQNEPLKILEDFIHRISAARQNMKIPSELSIVDIKLDSCDIALINVIAQLVLPVQRISLHNCSFSADTLRSACALFDSRYNLQSIDLSHNMIAKRSIDTILTAVQSMRAGGTNLLSLELSHNNLGDSGLARLIEFFREIPNRLQGMRVAHNQISDAGLVELTEAISKREIALYELCLGGNYLSPESIKKLLATLELTAVHLQTLELASSEITDELAPALARLMRTSSNLLSLDISYNQIQSEAVWQLIQTFFAAPSMRELIVTGNDINAALAKKLLRLGESVPPHKKVIFLTENMINYPTSDERDRDITPRKTAEFYTSSSILQRQADESLNEYSTVLGAKEAQQEIAAKLHSLHPTTREEKRYEYEATPRKSYTGTGSSFFAGVPVRAQDQWSTVKPMQSDTVQNQVLTQETLLKSPTTTDFKISRKQIPPVYQSLRIASSPKNSTEQEQQLSNSTKQRSDKSQQRSEIMVEFFSKKNSIQSSTKNQENKAANQFASNNPNSNVNYDQLRSSFKLFKPEQEEDVRYNANTSQRSPNIFQISKDKQNSIEKATTLKRSVSQYLPAIRSSISQTPPAEESYQKIESEKNFQTQQQLQSQKQYSLSIKKKPFTDNHQTQNKALNNNERRDSRQNDQRLKRSTVMYGSQSFEIEGKLLEQLAEKDTLQEPVQTPEHRNSTENFRTLQSSEQPLRSVRSLEQFKTVQSHYTASNSAARKRGLTPQDHLQRQQDRQIVEATEIQQFPNDGSEASSIIESPAEEEVQVNHPHILLPNTVRNGISPFDQSLKNERQERSPSPHSLQSTPKLKPYNTNSHSYSRSSVSSIRKAPSLQLKMRAPESQNVSLQQKSSQRKILSATNNQLLKHIQETEELLTKHAEGKRQSLRISELKSRCLQNTNCETELRQKILEEYKQLCEMERIVLEQQHQLENIIPVQIEQLRDQGVDCSVEVVNNWQLHARELLLVLHRFKSDKLTSETL